MDSGEQQERQFHTDFKNMFDKAELFCGKSGFEEFSVLLSCPVISLVNHKPGSGIIAKGISKVQEPGAGILGTLLKATTD